MAIRYLAALRVKGGSGTTTLAANLAGGLVRRRLRVLAVDCDPAAALTWTLAATPPPHDLAAVFAGVELTKAIVPTAVPGLDLLGAGELLTDWDRRPQVVRAAFAALLEGTDKLVHDVVIFDTAPTRGALLAGLLEELPQRRSGLLLPVLCAPLDLAGFSQALDLIRPGGPQLVGIVPSCVNKSALARDVLQAIRDAHGAKVLPEVREAAAVQRAVLKHMPVQYAYPNARAVADWDRLSAAVLRLIR